VLRVLIGPEIRQNAARSVFTRYLVRDSADYRQHLVQQTLIRISKVDQRWNVRFRNDNDVDRPERSRVAKGEDLLRLKDHLDRGSAAESFLAVEVLAHSRCISRL